jgi:hypothetical protein
MTAHSTPQCASTLNEARLPTGKDSRGAVFGSGVLDSEEAQPTATPVGGADLSSRTAQRCSPYPPTDFRCCSWAKPAGSLLRVPRRRRRRNAAATATTTTVPTTIHHIVGLSERRARHQDASPPNVDPGRSRGRA